MGKRRLLIVHFSVIKEELMGECFGLLMTHIYEKDKCSEIRMALQHQGDPLAVDKSFQDLLK
jgi:hypothetical protein